MTIIGKSKAAIAMIMDALKSGNRFMIDVKIFNNLGIEGEYLFDETPIKETDIIGSDFEFVLGAVMPATKKVLVEKYPVINRTIINATATVSRNAKIGTGSIIDALVSISSGVKTGRFVTIYSNSSIAHDVILDAFVTICPNVAVCGDVKIGEGTLIGAGSVIKNGITIGRNCVIGAGSVVIKDVEDGKTVYGNPAKEKIFKDRYGVPAENDSVLFDGKTHWRYCMTKENGNYLLSCTQGYKHDLSAIPEMEIIGRYEGNENLFNCD